MERFVYHGSPQGDLPVLKARKGTHQKECIYATDSEAVALLFMGKGLDEFFSKIFAKIFPNSHGI